MGALKSEEVFITSNICGNKEIRWERTKVSKNLDMRYPFERQYKKRNTQEERPTIKQKEPVKTRRGQFSYSHLVN